MDNRTDIDRPNENVSLDGALMAYMLCKAYAKCDPHLSQQFLAEAEEWKRIANSKGANLA
jgi:hypothetical protein